MQRLSFKKGLYTEQIEKLVAACDWLEIDRGRAARYGTLIREFFEDNARSQQHILAIGESCEIVDLFELWEHRVTDFPGLSRKIRSVFSKGPLLREEENPTVSSNRPRNDAFSHLVAGSLLAAGIPVVRSPIITAQGKPIYEFRPDCILKWLVFSNAQYAGPDVLRHLANRLSALLMG